MRSVVHHLGTVALTLGVVVFVVTAALGLAAFLLAARRLRRSTGCHHAAPWTSRSSSFR